MSEELALPPMTTVQLISNARRALVEARTLPDFRKVMEVAKVATDAAHRAAKLMEAQGVAAEVVQAANEAANDAAAVRIEAQAGAGQIVREMQDNGRIPGHAARGAKGGAAKRDGKSEPQTSYDEIGATKDAAWRWRKVADVPPGVRAEYVEATKEVGGEVTTAGLLRHAAAKRDVGDCEPQNGTVELERAYSAVTKAMATFMEYRNAGAVAAYAADSRRKSHFRKLVNRTRAWLDEAEQILE